jgi:hypothetical protein
MTSATVVSHSFAVVSGAIVDLLIVTPLFSIADLSNDDLSALVADLMAMATLAILSILVLLP